MLTATRIVNMLKMDRTDGGAIAWSAGTQETLKTKLSKAIGSFGAQLGSSKMGTLTQAWVPEPGEDGGVVMNTQGLPFCVNGTADLLALFRCISCKYKFTTDTTKPWMMGPVGRVYTSSEPELTRSVQQYDQSVYLRVAEAQRCHVNCCLFLPVFASPARDRVAAVMEVVQTEENTRFAGLVDWAKVCLEGAGLWTIEGDSDALPVGLRAIKAEYDASAFESKVEARVAPLRSVTAPPSMPPPPAPLTALRQGPAPSNPHSLGSVQPIEDSQGPYLTNGRQTGFLLQAAAEADDAAGGSGRTTVPQDLGTSNQGKPPTPTAPTKAKAVQVGNNLVLSSDGPADSGWPMQIGSGSGGSSEQVGQQQHSPLAAGMTIPQGYPTSYGHGDRTITIEDLAPHFHVSLRDAASRMGISVTTLKRACRRLGLQRWPRRELASRAQEVSNAAAQVAAAVAVTNHAQAFGDILSWGSGQTISADSSGEHLLGQAQAAAAAAAAAAQMPFHAQHLLRTPFPGCAGLPMFNDGGISNGQGHMHTQTHSLESLDILAAADVDTFSVGNSPAEGIFSTGCEGVGVGVGVRRSDPSTFPGVPALNGPTLAAVHGGGAPRAMAPHGQSC